MPDAARFLAICCLPALGVWFAADPLGAQGATNFSADLIRLQQGVPAVPAGRLAVSGGRARIDVPELPDGYFIIDAAEPSAIFVRAASSIYMDARRSSRLTRWFVPVDTADPCPRWQAMARLAGEPDRGGWHCEREGEAVIDGRNTMVYRAMVGSEQQFVASIDPTLGFPLRIELGDGTAFAVEAVTQQPLKSELTQIPAGFRKFDPQALIKRIKQSDVWVDAH
jgi:hypothetical protein